MSLLLSHLQGTISSILTRTASSLGVTTSAVSMAGGAIVTIALMGWLDLRKQISPFLHRNKTKKPWKMVPGRLPLLGHSYQISSFAAIEERLRQWVDEYGDPHVGCIEVDLFGDNCILVFTEERAHEVLKLRPRTVHRPLVVRRSINSIGATGLFSAEGTDWTKERKLVAAALNHKNVQDYFTAFRLVVNRLMDKWKRQAAASSSSSLKDSISIDPDLTRTAADAIALVSMGRDYNFLHQPDSQICKDIRLALEAFEFRSLFAANLPYWLVPKIGQYLDGYGGSIYRVQDLIQHAISEEEERESRSRVEPNDDKANQLPNPNQTFLHKLFAVMNSERSPIERSRVNGNVLTLFFAGTDTSSKTLLIALYFVAKDPQLQRDLYLQVQGRDDLDRMNLTELSNELPLLKSFLHEIHRWYGVFFMGLQTDDEMEFCHTTVPKGTSFLLLHRYISTSYKVRAPGVPAGPYSKPSHEFCPFRWLVPKDGAAATTTTSTAASASPPWSSWVCQSPGITNLSYLPFGYGVRSCPGRTYSEGLSLLVLAKTVQTFQLTLPSDHPPVKFVSGITMIPDCDIRLLFELRDSNTSSSTSSTG